MSWVTIIWSMIAATCLTLAVVHGFIWFRKRDAWASLWFAFTAVGTAARAMLELALMQSETPAAMAVIFRWGHLVVWLLLVSLVGFVRVYLRAGNRWLAWSALGARTLALGANFLTGQNLNYRELTGLRHLQWFGETVAAPEGVPNPWMLLGQFSLLLLFVAGRPSKCGGGESADAR